MADGNGGDDSSPRGRPGNGGWAPVSDPSWLTTQQLRETEGALDRSIHERIASLRELLESRLSGMDEATHLLSDRLETLGETLDSRSDLREKTLQALLEQRLDGMDRATELLAGQVAKILADAKVAMQREREDGVVQAAALRALLEARLDAMDKAAELLAATVGKVPSETDKAINALRELLASRIDGMDTATKLLADSMSKFPSDIDRAVSALKAVVLGEIQRVQDVLTAEISRIGAITQEKFAAIDGTFSSNALALTAALAAQKEAAAEQNKSNTLAITKSESSTKETIAANAVQAQNGLASQKNQFEDLKERVVRIESTGAGATSVTGSPFDAATFRQSEKAAEQAAAVAQAAQGRAIMALGISGVLLLISIVSVIFAITKK